MPACVVAVVALPAAAVADEAVAVWLEAAAVCEAAAAVALPDAAVTAAERLPTPSAIALASVDCAPDSVVTVEPVPLAGPCTMSWNRSESVTVCATAADRSVASDMVVRRVRRKAFRELGCEIHRRQ